jgi:hypothetical protein
MPIVFARSFCVTAIFGSHATPPPPDRRSRAFASRLAVKEHDALDSGLSQMPAQDLDQLDRDLRFFSYQRQKVSPIDDEHLAIADSYRVRCAWTAVEQGNFSRRRHPRSRD